MEVALIYKYMQEQHNQQYYGKTKTVLLKTPHNVCKKPIILPAN